MPFSEAQFDFVTHHVILPPKLPQVQEDDNDTKKGELAIATLALRAAKDFSSELDQEFTSQWQHIIHMLRDSKHLCKRGMSREVLEQKISSMETGGMFSTPFCMLC